MEQQNYLIIDTSDEVPYYQMENNTIDIGGILSPIQFYVYTILWRLAQNHNEKIAFPSKNYLVKQTKSSKPTVSKTITELQDLGFIEVTKQYNEEQQRHYANIYRVFSYTRAFKQLVDIGHAEALKILEEQEKRQILGGKTTLLPHDKILGKGGKATLPGVGKNITEGGKEYYPEVVKPLAEGGKATLPYKDIPIKEEEEDKKKKEKIQQSLANVQDCLKNLLSFPTEWINTIIHEFQKYDLILSIKEIMMLTDLYERLAEQIDSIHKFDIYFATCYLEELRKERSKKIAKQFKEID